MTIPKPSMMTARELFRLPGVNSKHAELIAGVLRVGEPSGSQSSWVSLRIAMFLGVYVMEHDLGELTSEAGGYILKHNPDTVRAPDVAFVKRARLPVSGFTPYFFDGAPDLAVEVLSLSDRPKAVRAKVSDYLETGTQLIWVVDPQRRVVIVHRPGAAPEVVTEHGTLDGEGVVPGFRLAVVKILPRSTSSER